MSKNLNAKPHKDIPRAEDINRDTLIADIKKKVKDAEKNGNFRTFTTTGKAIDFPVIEIERGRLLYNLTNDRTLISCEEYEIENKCKDFFGLKNFWNAASQQAYHKIIFDYIPSEMADVLAVTKNQRDEIFITSQGVVANGNTRLACMREFVSNKVSDQFKIIKCCVIDEQDSNDWGWIRRLVDSMDNQESFSAVYPWYGRARRFEKNCIDKGLKNITSPHDAGGPKLQDIKKISESMAYKTPAIAIEAFGMLELARAFVKEGFLRDVNDPRGRFSKLSDLDKLGPKAGRQAFETFYRGDKKVQIELIAREKLRQIVFGVIATNANKRKGEHYATSNLHLLIQKLYSDDNIKEIIKKYGSTKKAPNKFTKSSTQTKPKKVSNKKSVHNWTEKDSVTKILADIAPDLNAATDIAATKAGAKIERRYDTTIERIIKQTKDARIEQLKDDSNLDGTRDKVEKLIKELNQHLTHIDAIVDSQSK